MARTMANAPAVLDAYLAMSGALAAGVLAPPLRERIALAVAEANGSDYCLSAHAALGKLARLTEAEIEESRAGRARESRADAALRFARAVLDGRGDVLDEDLARLRAAGFADAEVAEIVAHVALNVFTNFFNKVAGVAVDFPLVTARAA
jgi:AhpD family alkylhydroperoxidase